METKYDLIKLVDEAEASDVIKKMVKAYIDRAYTAGFNQGMIRGSQAMSSTFEMLLGSSRKELVKQ